MAKRLENIENRRWEIYTLSHPFTNQVKYVGVTFCGLQRRLSQHIRDKRKTYKTDWVQNLIKQNLTPVINLIEEGYGFGWEQAEQTQIAAYRENSNLTNLTGGGGGCLSPSQGTRLKMSQAATGKKASQGTRLKMSAKAKLEVVNNSERWQKFVQVRDSQENRFKISESNKNRSFSEETRRKMSQAFKGKKPVNLVQLRILSESKRKGVFCLETGEFYISLTEAAKLLGSSDFGNLSRAIRTGGRYRGKHYQYLDKADITKLPPVSTKLQQLRLF